MAVTPEEEERIREDERRKLEANRAGSSGGGFSLWDMLWTGFFGAIVVGILGYALKSSEGLRNFVSENLGPQAELMINGLFDGLGMEGPFQTMTTLGEALDAAKENDGFRQSIAERLGVNEGVITAVANMDAEAQNTALALIDSSLTRDSDIFDAMENIQGNENLATIMQTLTTAGVATPAAIAAAAEGLAVASEFLSRPAKDLEDKTNRDVVLEFLDNVNIEMDKLIAALPADGGTLDFTNLIDMMVGQDGFATGNVEHLGKLLTHINLGDDAPEQIAALRTFLTTKAADGTYPALEALTALLNSLKDDTESLAAINGLLSGAIDFNHIKTLLIDPEALAALRQFKTDISGIEGADTLGINTALDLIDSHDDILASALTDHNIRVLNTLYTDLKGIDTSALLGALFPAGGGTGGLIALISDHAKKQAVAEFFSQSGVIGALDKFFADDGFDIAAIAATGDAQASADALKTQLETMRTNWPEWKEKLKTVNGINAIITEEAAKAVRGFFSWNSSAAPKPPADTQITYSPAGDAALSLAALPAHVRRATELA